MDVADNGVPNGECCCLSMDRSIDGLVAMDGNGAKRQMAIMTLHVTCHLELEWK